MLVLSPEAIATVDVALARVGNTHVGADDLSSVKPKSTELRQAKVSWWNLRTQFHYENRKSFRQAFVKYWEAASRRLSNMVCDEQGSAADSASAGNTKTLSPQMCGYCDEKQTHSWALSCCVSQEDAPTTGSRADDDEEGEEEEEEEEEEDDQVTHPCNQRVRYSTNHYTPTDTVRERVQFKTHYEKVGLEVLCDRDCPKPGCMNRVRTDLVRVASSELLPGQLGLFACADIQEGTVIACFGDVRELRVGEDGTRTRSG